MKTMTYCEAINEAIHQEMERDSRVFVYGIGVPDHKNIFDSTSGILERFGPNRCFDTPIAEDSMTGFGLGAAINGLRPIHVHIRVDFLLLAMNQLANMVSSFHYGSGGKTAVPLVIRAVVGRGWGQGYQHSKSMHSTFAHIPGLKVIAPTTVADAKGMMVSAIRDNNPVLVFEHRWLYWQEGKVPTGDYTVRIGKPNIIRKGSDLTVIATSWMNVEAIRAAEILIRRGVNIEIVDPRSISPLEDELLVASVEKTGHCIVADNDWSYCGFGAEIAAIISEKCFGKLKSPVTRIGFAHTPCPTVRSLENAFYPNAESIIRAVELKLGLPPMDLSREIFFSHENRFKGPF
jgi:pyruvate/2-oxoglutarate/acetoin dehydrogenase E1 component